MITKRLNSKRGGKVYVAFVDYKKAFDTADPEKLWDVHQKLQTPFKMTILDKCRHKQKFSQLQGEHKM